jgi:hypothetical protein
MSPSSLAKEPKAPHVSFTVEVNAAALRTMNTGGIYMSLTQYELSSEVP